HRLVHGLPEVSLDEVIARVQTWFEVSTTPLPEDARELRDALQRAGQESAAFGLTVPGSKALTVLRLRSDYDPNAAGLGDLPPALSRLDVVLLHELVLERALGISKQAQEAKTNLRYYKS